MHIQYIQKTHHCSHYHTKLLKSLHIIQTTVSHSMTNRLLNIPLNQTDNIKVNMIKNTAQENGYDPQLTETPIKKMQNGKKSKPIQKKLRLATRNT